MARKLVVEIIGDSRSLERSFARSAKAGKQFGVSMTGIGRSIAGVTAVFAGAAGFTSVVRTAFSEMAESNKVMAQTNAVLKSTGGVAGVTAAHVHDLADALLRKTGIDDEAIASAENLLLTFTNVRNVVGQGNDIFDQATRTILDMSAVQGDLESNTRAIGKALQDPIRGVTALRRVGVALTVQQEQQIKTLVKQGRVMDAQKIILRELTTEFGGQAEAVGNVQPWNRLRETIANISGDLAQKLMPAITDAADRLQTWLDDTGNVARIQSAFDTIIRTIGKIAGAVGRVNTALGGWKDTLTIVTGLWVGFKLAGMTSATAVLAANTYAAAGTAAAWRAALISTGFGALAVAAGLAATYIVTHWEKVKDWFRQFWLWLEYTGNQAALAVVEPFSHLPDRAGEWARDAKEAILANLEGIDQDMAAVGEKAGEAFNQGMQRTLGAGPGMTPPGWLPGGTGAKPPGGGGGGAGGGGRKGVTQTQRNQWFDAMIGRKQERARSIADLRDIVRDLEARLKITKDITRRMRLQDEIWQMQQQIAARSRQLQEERQATQLGWLEFAVERAEATKTLNDDLKTMRAIEAYWKERIRQEGRTLDNVTELYRIQQRIRDLHKKNTDTDPLAGLMQASTKKLTAMLAAGTGLGVGGRRVLGANISGLQMRPVYVSVQMDGREVGRAVTKQQTRTGKRTARQTSGSR